jgi:hypothetical protein
VQSFALLVQHRAVRHLLRQDMLEDVFHLGKGRLLVEKLLALERRQQPVEVGFRLENDLRIKLNGNRPMTEAVAAELSRLTPVGRCAPPELLARWTAGKRHHVLREPILPGAPVRVPSSTSVRRLLP